MYSTLRRLQTSQTGLLHSITLVNDSLSADLAIKKPRRQVSAPGKQNLRVTSPKGKNSKFIRALEAEENPINTLSEPTNRGLR